MLVLSFPKSDIDFLEDGKNSSPGFNKLVQTNDMRPISTVAPHSPRLDPGLARVCLRDAQSGAVFLSRPILSLSISFPREV